jgi:hypothetical protein
MQEMYGDDVITTADKLEKPPKTVIREIFEDFNARNPKADGGQLVAPSVDGSRPGYAEPVGNRKGRFTSESMDNISDAILKAYADDDISLLFEKNKANPTGLISPKDAKQGIFSKIKVDQDRLNTIVKNTGLDQETILNIIDDRDAYIDLERTSSSQATRYRDRIKFFNQAEKWLTTNAKRYSDPKKFEKAFIRTFGKNNLITKTIKANIENTRGRGRLSGFSDDFVKTIMSVREGTTKADNAFNSIQLKEMFKTVIYNNNPNVRKKITTIFENIIPEPGSKRTPDIRDLFANNATLKKYGLDKSIKGPIARLIFKEIGEDLFTNVKNFQKPFLGTDALLSFLKDRVDPKYKEMFREASNAVKQAQKNQWPQAKKSLNLSQAIMFDHKIPKALIEAGYADEIEYIKLNPTSEKFNATIKRSQFDQPLISLIDEFERSKTLDAKANVVTKMNKLKNDFSKKYGGYLDNVSIKVDKTGKPIFKSSAAPVTKKTDLLKSLKTSLQQEKFPKMSNKKQIKFLNDIQANSKLDECRLDSAEGGRIGFAFSNKCIRDGLEETKKKAAAGDKKAARQLVETAEAATKGGRLLKNVLGPGALLGEAVYEGALIGNKILGGKPKDIAWAESYLSYLDPRKYRGELDPLKMAREDMLTRKVEDAEGNIKTIDAPGSSVLRSGFAAQDQLSAANKAIENRNIAKARKRIEQYLPAAADAREQAARANLSAKIISSDAFKDASRIAQEYLQGQTGANIAKYRTDDFGRFESGRDRDLRKRRMKEMRELNPLMSDQQILEILKEYNIDPKDYDYTYTPRYFPADISSKSLTGFDDIRDFYQQENAMQNIADAGGVANLAGGGLANLTNTIPPKSGPMSQGLRSLYNNGRKL